MAQGESSERWSSRRGEAMAERVIVRRGTFVDSVTLMMASRDAENLDGIAEASIVNATPFNVELVEGQGFSLAGEEELGPNDLVIVFRGESEEALDAALASIEERLERKGERARSSTDRAAPRSVTSAARRRADLGLAVISVPGQHAAYECARALDAGLDVFCFSSGPTLEAEAVLKTRAIELGLMLMGPDCGTAILNGICLGFGNAVREGPVGIVGASGTGIQAITCLLDAGGVGISQAIGVGGRDLSHQVGGSMTLRGIELLTADRETETIVVVAKSPHPGVARRVAAAATRSGKRAVIAFPGLRVAADGEVGFDFATSLTEAAASAARSVGATLPAPARRGSVGSTRGAIRGLFSGGTLRDEAMAIVGESAGRVESWLGEDPTGAHVLVDLGDERFTQGRAHPMIDPSLRVSLLDQQSREAKVSVLLLDVVLGYAAHPDPAGELAPVIERALDRRPGELSFVVSLCGTDRDPQDLDRQADRLHRAGAVVTQSNADAAHLALEAAGLERTAP